MNRLFSEHYDAGFISRSPSRSGQTHLPGSEPGVLLIGRFDTRDPCGPKFGWSATTIKARFQGTGVSASLTSGGDNWINVIIDGILYTTVHIPPGTNKSPPLPLATGLSPGTHTIEIVRRTEAWLGEMQFLGFTLPSGTLLPPPPPSSRRIEFIGDSITCGYGNESRDPDQTFTPENENAYRAYGSITARLLGADQMTVAWSGKGVIRNYDGSTDETMPELYPRILPFETTHLWDPSQWVPHVVVINLGTNDFGPEILDRNRFISGYRDFVQTIRAQYPETHIYCALGPVLLDNHLVSAREHICSVVNSLTSSGDRRIHFIEFPFQDGSLGFGEDWHPSAKTHQAMACQLTDQIKKDLGW